MQRIVSFARRIPAGLALRFGLIGSWLAFTCAFILVTLDASVPPKRCADEVMAVAGQPDAQVEIKFVNTSYLDEHSAVDQFHDIMDKSEACYRNALPSEVDWDQDQGDLDLLVVVGEDGYATDIRAHGRTETLEVFRHCFEPFIARYWFGEPMGQPAAAIGHYRLLLPEDAPRRARKVPPARNRVNPRVLGRDPDSGDGGRLFVLAQLRQIERCYDDFLEKHQVSGSVELHVSITRRDKVEIRTRASKRKLRPVARCIAKQAKTWASVTDVARPYSPLEVRYDLRAEAPPRDPPRGR